MAKAHTGGSRPDSNRQGRTRNTDDSVGSREKTRGSGEERTAGLTACCGDGADSRARATATSASGVRQERGSPIPLTPKFYEGRAAKQTERRDIPGQTHA